MAKRSIERRVSRMIYDLPPYTAELVMIVMVVTLAISILFAAGEGG